MSARGLFVTFEGGEGSGKSTQIKRVARQLEAAGVAVRVLREPGGTTAGERIRAILLDPESAGMDARTELLLYEAARAQLVAEVVEPALASGEVILCDRFFDSTTAYQGYGRGLDLDEIDALNRAATGGLAPHRTVLLDVDPSIGLGRATRGGADRLESEDLAFHQRVRAGFLKIAQAEPERFRLVDGTGSADMVAHRVSHALEDLLGVAAPEESE
jgi:dTMP kinase